MAGYQIGLITRHGHDEQITVPVGPTDGGDALQEWLRHHYPDADWRTWRPLYGVTKTAQGGWSGD